MQRSFLKKVPMIVAMMFMTACVGGNINIVVPTLGKQLEDLEKARSSGAISEAEYEKQRARYLESGGIPRDAPIVSQDEDSES